MVTLKSKAPSVRVSRKPVSAPVVEAPPVAAPAPEPVAAAQEPAAPSVMAGDVEDRPSRSERVPLGTMRLKLATEDRPGFVRRWFNEEGGRIQQAKAAGYTFVKDEKGLPRKTIVGTAKIGGGLTAYLMEVPEEYYLEDMAAKDSVARQFDKDIRRGAGPGTAPGDDGRYVPMKPDGTPRIEIKESVRRG